MTNTGDPEHPPPPRNTADPGSEMLVEPAAPEPDTKDWSFAATEFCPECGFDPAEVADTQLPAALRATLPRWQAVLQRPAVAVRPASTVWSALEYACHVRDVHQLFAERVTLMLTHDAPTFANWDQDDAARTGRYWEADPSQLAEELAAATEAAARIYHNVPSAEWQRTGMRGDGGHFTVSTLGHYHLHDIIHHLHDVAG